MRHTDFPAGRVADPSTDFVHWLAQQAQRVEAVLHEWLPVCAPAHADRPDEPATLHETRPPETTLHQAMRYAVLGGGKRVRAALVYAAAHACLKPACLKHGTAGSSTHAGNTTLSLAQQTALNRCAAAVELLHAYSLVHDDLPCMDDDALRRGRATVHRQFDEATALLTGDALQALAFEWLAQMPIAPALVVQSVELLARAAGSCGMVGGQAIDCASVGQRLTHAQLQTMHAMKTGALLQASILLGGTVAAASSQQREALENYARAAGLAFQVADDILDNVASTATLGKTAGKDAAQDKPTYVSLLGQQGAQDLLVDLTGAAHDALRPLGPAGLRLAQLADFIAQRRY